MEILNYMQEENELQRFVRVFIQQQRLRLKLEQK